MESWKSKLARVREMCCDAREWLFRLAQLLTVIHGDPAFLEWCRENDRHPTEELDSELEDTPYNYFLLSGVAKNYPDQEVWRTTPLERLISDTFSGPNSSELDDVETIDPADIDSQTRTAEQEMFESQLIAIAKTLKPESFADISKMLIRFGEVLGESESESGDDTLSQYTKMIGDSRVQVVAHLARSLGERIASLPQP